MSAMANEHTFSDTVSDVLYSVDVSIAPSGKYADGIFPSTFPQR